APRERPRARVGGGRDVGRPRPLLLGQPHRRARERRPYALLRAAQLPGRVRLLVRARLQQPLVAGVAPPAADGGERLPRRLLPRRLRLSRDRPAPGRRALAGPPAGAVGPRLALLTRPVRCSPQWRCLGSGISGRASPP